MCMRIIKSLSRFEAWFGSAFGTAVIHKKISKTLPMKKNRCRTPFLTIFDLLNEKKW